MYQVPGIPQVFDLSRPEQKPWIGIARGNGWKICPKFTKIVYLLFCTKFSTKTKLRYFSQNLQWPQMNIFRWPTSKALLKSSEPLFWAPERKQYMGLKRSKYFLRSQSLVFAQGGSFVGVQGWEVSPRIKMGWKIYFLDDFVTKNPHTGNTIN